MSTTTSNTSKAKAKAKGSPFFQLVKVATCSLLTLQLLLYQFILAFRQPPVPPTSSSTFNSPSSSPSHHHDHLTDLWATLLFILTIACNGVALYAALVQQPSTPSRALRRTLRLFLVIVCPTSALVALWKVTFSTGAHGLRGLALFALVTNLLAIPLVFTLERLLASKQSAGKKVLVKMNNSELVEMVEMGGEVEEEEDRRPFNSKVVNVMCT